MTSSQLTLLDDEWPERLSEQMLKQGIDLYNNDCSMFSGVFLVVPGCPHFPNYYKKYDHQIISDCKYRRLNTDTLRFIKWHIKQCSQITIYSQCLLLLFLFLLLLLLLLLHKGWCTWNVTDSKWIDIAAHQSTRRAYNAIYCTYVVCRYKWQKRKHEVHGLRRSPEKRSGPFN